LKINEEIIKLAEKNNGILLTKQVTNAGYSRSALKILVDEGILSQVQRGVYITENGYIDDFFLLQQKFKTGIFSHETALYLLGFSDRSPMQITMTFEHGHSTPRIKKAGVKPIMVSTNFTTGQTLLNRNGSNIVVYEIERTLIDLLKPRYNADYEQLIPALKKYANFAKKDINKLFRYAKKFDVETQVRNYMEVLL